MKVAVKSLYDFVESGLERRHVLVIADQLGGPSVHAARSYSDPDRPELTTKNPFNFVGCGG